MKMMFFKNISALGLLMAAVLAAPAPAAQAATRPAEPAAPQDTPEVFIASGVGDYAMAAPKLFFHQHTCDPRPPASIQINPDVETIGREAVQGSPIRMLMNRSASGYCGVLLHTANSNIVADASYLYWITDQGLVRLSVNANLGDAPEVINPALVSYYQAELAMDSDFVYVLTKSSNTSSLSKTQKTTNGYTLLRNIGAAAYNLQVSHAYAFIGNYHGDYAYWIDGGVLRRFNLNTSALDNLASGVRDYYAEGAHSLCVNLACTVSDLVYLSTGQFLFYTSNRTLGTVTQVYNAGSSNDYVYSIVTDTNYVYFLQEHCSPSGLFCNNTDYVVRHARSNTGSAAFLAVSQTSVNRTYQHLTLADKYLFWQANSSILRLPGDAASLPNTNMRITGMSITQGIQKGSGSGVEDNVFLVQGRRTFLRLFVKSDGPDVPGVTAMLHLVNSDGGRIDSVLPVNSVGTNLTVRASPNRANLDDSFLFELPWSWIPDNINTPLYLRAELNPYHAPIESNYADDLLNSGQHAFAQSAALKVQFVSWGYSLNGSTYYPRLVKDIVQTYSWIIRAYPLASALVFDGAAGSQPGLHPNLWMQFDDSLGAKVNQTDKSCTDNLCASAYTDSQMGVMRSDNGLPDSRFFYGFISDAAGFFPRGQACCATNVSTGPAGMPGASFGWDTDGSYADWYAAHEIGHTLGRAHPSPSAASCGNSASDDAYPYTGGQIGPDNNTEGFDTGDSAFGVPRAIYPGKTWFDVMSYCNNQWISDYTYQGMWSYMDTHPSLAASAKPERHLLNGDFLHAYGRIYANSATIDTLWRAQVVNATTPVSSGGYAIRLLDAASAALAEYEFTPQSGESADYSSYGVIIPFADGARMAQIVRLADGAVLASWAISANAPVVSNVALQNPPNPVSGVVTLAWEASDADGDPLTYSVRYTRDGGATWVTAVSGLSATSVSVDTSTLGGGSGQFRVIASDGANTGYADGDPFDMENKAPIPMILNPDTGLHIHYGQLINFSGAAMDWQDGGVAGANLTWASSRDGSLGNGPQISSQSLSIGTHVITLKAVNTAGLNADTTITVIVDDDLSLNGPTLTAGPLQFDWNVAANETAPASDVLHISNAGSGALNWTASSDVAWLTFSAASGAAPANVTLTADPGAIPNNTSASGMVTLTSPATSSGPAQTIKIHVSLTKGVDPANPPGFTQVMRMQWLPMMWK